MWRTIQKLLGTVIPGLLIALYLVVAASFLNRWDAMVAVTITPIWAWAAMGMLIASVCWIVCRNRLSGLLLCLFLATAIACSEEVHTFVREFATSVMKPEGVVPAPSKSIRIVTVDCGGSAASLHRAADEKPDVLIIQHAPDKTVLDSVADALYGLDRSVTTVGSNAILGRGETLGVIGEASGPALHVRLKRPDGFILDISNLDLRGCAPTLDLWRPEMWKKLIASRIETRRLIRTHLGEHPINSDKVGRIVCGGFGSPPGDDVFRPLETSGMLDSYALAGQGWGNTYPSDYPVLRLDQIWVSPNLEPLKVVTRRNPDSSHRIVVSDVKLPAL